MLRPMLDRRLIALSVLGPVAGLLALAILTACESGSKRRACEPVLQTGCEGGQVCSLDDDGVPGCFAAGSGIEGDACQTATDCGPALGCIRLSGAARCLRFCSPTTETDSCLADVGTHPYSEFARCIGVAIDRADIGICALPCSPGEPLCPEGTHCGLSPEAGLAVCKPVGESPAEADCDGLAGCQDGLACVPHGDRFVCRPYATDGCEAPTVQTSVPGIRDAVTNDEIQVCARCVAVGQVGAFGELITVCPEARIADEACVDEGGEPPRLLDTLHAESIDRIAPFDEPWWTGARRGEFGWFWPDQAAVLPALTPTGEGDCAVWNDGVHEARDCATKAASVCALASGDLAE